MTLRSRVGFIHKLKNYVIAALIYV